MWLHLTFCCLELLYIFPETVRNKTNNLLYWTIMPIMYSQNEDDATTII